ncbi:MAG: tetratricopeptide repeat protein [Anaerolineae bacterium]
MAMAQSSISRTSGSVLRDLLRKYEIGVANPKDKGQAALEVFRLRDEIEESITKLQADRVDIRSELSRLESADAVLRRGTAKFVRELKASGGLAAVRTVESPSANKWWWYIDVVLATKNKRAFTSTAIIAAIVIVVVVGGFIIVDRVAGPPTNVRDALKFIGQAEAALQQKDYDTAITLYEQAATLTPPLSRITPTPVFEGTPQKFTYSYSNADPQVYLAALYAIKGRTADAARMEQDAEAIMGTRVVVLESIAQAFFNMNELDRASATIEELMKLKPDNARGFYIRGSISEARDQLQDALVDFQKAAQLAQEQFNSTLFAMAQTRYVNLLQRLPNQSPTQEGGS